MRLSIAAGCVRLEGFRLVNICHSRPESVSLPVHHGNAAKAPACTERRRANGLLGKPGTQKWCSFERSAASAARQTCLARLSTRNVRAEARPE